MEKIIILMLLSVFFGGYAYARVWHKTDSDMPTTEIEVQTALSECLQTNEVASWHSQALTWRYICIWDDMDSSCKYRNVSRIRCHSRQI
jgi:hypothetical protein